MAGILLNQVCSSSSDTKERVSFSIKLPSRFITSIIIRQECVYQLRIDMISYNNESSCGSLMVAMNTCEFTHFSVLTHRQPLSVSYFLFLLRYKSSMTFRYPFLGKK